MNSLLRVPSFAVGGTILGFFAGIAWAFVVLYLGNVPQTTDGTFGMERMFGYPTIGALLGAFFAVVLSVRNARS